MNSEIGADDFVRPHLGRARAEAASRAAAPHTATLQPAARPAPQSGGLNQADGPVGERYSGAPGSDGEGADFGFADLLDIINPLHHIPVVSTLYREMTGDEISAPARVLGGVLYGGGVGLVSSMVEVVASEAAGQDMDKAILAALIGDDRKDPAAQNAGSAPNTIVEEDGIHQDSPETVSAVAPPPTAPAGKREPVLTGGAAIEAFLSDLAKVQDEANLAQDAAAASDSALVGTGASGGVGIPLPLPNALSPGLTAPGASVGAVPSAQPGRQQVEVPRVMPLRSRDWGQGTPRPVPLPTQFGGNGAVYPGLSGRILQGAAVGAFPSALDPGLIAAHRVAAGELGTEQGAAGFSERMLRGVERYEAMARAGKAQAPQ